jgi:heterogeneous nuclear ribonucleoprotein F/H
LLHNCSSFSEADARKAMTKDRQNMQHRYVELFYDGPSGGGMGRGGPGMGAGGPPMGGGYGRPAPAAGGFNSSMSGSGGGYSGGTYY